MRRLLALGLLFFLAGCYLPTNFEADLNIDEKGRFGYRYVGDIISLPLLQKIVKGEISGSELNEQVAVYKRDLTRDSGFKQADYVGDGRFKVRFEYQNDIRTSKSFTFIRSNAMFLRLKLREDGFVELQGNRPPRRIVNDLIARGYDVRGVLRVWTTAKVLKHNATEMRDGSPNLYIWNIRSMRDALPSLIFLPK